jgi:small conductance mechanosensitive channel
MDIIKILLSDQVVKPIIYILVGYIAYLMTSKALNRIYKLDLKGDDKKRRTITNLFKSIIKWVIIIIVILLVLDAFNINTGAIAASLGAASLVIGLAFQDLLKDFIAGIFSIFDEQYNIGDIVKINDFKGEVIDIGLRTTKLKAYTGEIYAVRNGKIVEVTNYTITNSMAKVNIDVAYEEDLDKVLTKLEELTSKLNSEIDVLINPIQVLGVTKLGDNGITITIVAETQPMRHFEVERLLRKEIKNNFDKEGINIPYPQVVVHNERL